MIGRIDILDCQAGRSRELDVVCTDDAGDPLDILDYQGQPS